MFTVWCEGDSPLPCPGGHPLDELLRLDLREPCDPVPPDESLRCADVATIAAIALKSVETFWHVSVTTRSVLDVTARGSFVWRCKQSKISWICITSDRVDTSQSYNGYRYVSHLKGWILPSPTMDTDIYHIRQGWYFPVLLGI